MFKLPSYQELSKEQDAVNNLPLSGTHLVVGPPGTGKTVLAIYRAEMFKRAEQSTRFIVYNKTLKQYLVQATSHRDVEADTMTFHSWFWHWYKDVFRRRPPQTEPYCFDWMTIFEKLMKAGTRVASHKVDHVVLDEAQDFPREAFLVLAQTAKHLTVFADENQRITDRHSTIHEIGKALGIEGVSKLTKNYRNSRPIAEFAAEFYTGLSTGIPDPPDRKGQKPIVMKTGDDVRLEAGVVTAHAKAHPSHDIGVLLPRTRQQKDFIGEVERALRRAGIKTPVQMYVSQDDRYKAVDFGQPGIKIINYQSAKGLEFDAVFLPRLDTYHGDPVSDSTRMKLYMLTSRARDHLCIMHTSDRLPTALDHVPQELYAAATVGRRS